MSKLNEINSTYTFLCFCLSSIIILCYIFETLSSCLLCSFRVTLKQICVGQAPHLKLGKLNEELEIQADTMLIDLLHEQLRDREKSANRQAEVDAKLVEDEMRIGADADLAIPRPELLSSMPKGRAPDWELLQDFEEELIVQCSELLPGLLVKMHEN